MNVWSDSDSSISFFFSLHPWVQHQCKNKRLLGYTLLLEEDNPGLLVMPFDWPLFIPFSTTTSYKQAHFTTGSQVGSKIFTEFKGIVPPTFKCNSFEPCSPIEWPGSPMSTIKQTIFNIVAPKYLWPTRDAPDSSLPLPVLMWLAWRPCSALMHHRGLLWTLCEPSTRLPWSLKGLGYIHTLLFWTSSVRNTHDVTHEV